MKFLLLMMYVAAGFYLNKKVPLAKKVLPRFLVRYVIPFVIFLTCFFYSDGLVSIAGLMFSFCFVMFLCSLVIYRHHPHKNVMRLCLTQYNIGLIGLPVSIHFFGDGAIPIILAAFLGGMLFCNSIGLLGLIHSNQLHKTYLLKQMLASPPLIALALATFLLTCGVSLDFSGVIGQVYDVSKSLLSILGMIVMGICLSHHPVSQSEWRQYISFSLSKMMLGLCVALMLFGGAYLQGFIEERSFYYLMLLPFLPTAANIITLESHYRGTGHSASMVCANTIIASTWLVCFNFFNF